MLPAIPRRARPPFLAALLAAGCGGAEAEPLAILSAEPGEELSGGDTTVFDTTPNAFSFSARNMTSERRSDFFVGNSFFKDSWVTAPASTEGRDGLGPLYNARSCTACHFKDGRGAPPEPGEPMVSMLIRLSVPGAGEHGAMTIAAPSGFGTTSSSLIALPLPQVAATHRPVWRFGRGHPDSIRYQDVNL